MEKINKRQTISSHACSNSVVFKFMILAFSIFKEVKGEDGFEDAIKQIKKLADISE